MSIDSNDNTGSNGNINFYSNDKTSSINLFYNIETMPMLTDSSDISDTFFCIDSSDNTDIFSAWMNNDNDFTDSNDIINRYNYCPLTILS